MKITQTAKRMWIGVKALAMQTPPPSHTTKRNFEDIKKVNAALIPLLALGMVAALWVGWGASSIGPVLLWCVACLAVGGTVGFLFGIPRATAQPATPSAARTQDAGKAESKLRSSDRDTEGGRPNTNLEEVSDWLTKILVGLTLVNLSTIETRVMAISRNAAAALREKPTDTDVSTATALVVGFAVIGFLCGYLYTRLFLQGAFSRSDSDMRRFRLVLAEELSQAGPEPAPPSGQPSVPSASDRQSAERVLKVTPVDQPDAVLSSLRALAADYEDLRQNMSFGRERTRKMSEVVSLMRRLALAAEPFLPQLTKSQSPGERLAAVIVLQMRFDPSFIEWLAGRLHEESAFIGYQAASALLARVRLAGPPEKLAIKTAVDAAISKGIRPEAERDKLVEEILKEAAR